MNERENKNFLSLELSKDSLSGLLRDLGSVLARKGAIVELTRDIIPLEGEPAPARFEYPIDKQFAKELFYPGDECLLRSAEIAYTTAHAIDPDDPQNRMDGSAILILTSLLPDPSRHQSEWVEREETYWIYQDLSNFSGQFETEYGTQDGHRISPNGIDPSVDLFDPETGDMRRTKEADKFFDDQNVLKRPLTHEDEEVLRKLMAYIETQPTLT